jgi:hypothetical protein
LGANPSDQPPNSVFDSVRHWQVGKGDHAALTNRYVTALEQIIAPELAHRNHVVGIPLLTIRALRPSLDVGGCEQSNGIRIPTDGAGTFKVAAEQVLP